MDPWSALRRLAVTVPFFCLAGLLLAFWADSTTIQTPSPAGNSLVLIVTSPPLSPAFQALQAWNQEQGCPTSIVVLEEDLKDVSRDWHTRISSLCRQYGATGVLLGGDRKQVPMFPGELSQSSLSGASQTAVRVKPVPMRTEVPLPEGLVVGRVAVGNLSEAWDFVKACRATGVTLDELIPVAPELTQLVVPEASEAWPWPAEVAAYSAPSITAGP